MKMFDLINKRVHELRNPQIKFCGKCNHQGFGDDCKFGSIVKRDFFEEKSVPQFKMSEKNKFNTCSDCAPIDYCDR